MSKTVVALICPRHGYMLGDHCAKCEDVKGEGVRVNTNDWVRGWYEHIGPQPIYIRDKQHLFQECEKHGNMPKAFLKPKSQGKGYEIKRRGL